MEKMLIDEINGPKAQDVASNQERVAKLLKRLGAKTNPP